MDGIVRNKIKKLKNDFEVEHKIDDPDGISKQYPKVMKNPAKHGFTWQSSVIGINYVKTGD